MARIVLGSNLTAREIGDTHNRAFRRFYGIELMTITCDSVRPHGPRLLVTYTPYLIGMDWFPNKKPVD